VIKPNKHIMIHYSLLGYHCAAYVIGLNVFVDPLPSQKILPPSSGLTSLSKAYPTLHHDDYSDYS